MRVQHATGQGYGVLEGGFRVREAADRETRYETGAIPVRGLFGGLVAGGFAGGGGGAGRSGETRGDGVFALHGWHGTVTGTSDRVHVLVFRCTRQPGWRVRGVDVDPALRT